MPDKDPRARRQEAAEKIAADVRDSARKIWLAGLGVFDATREEGGKLFKKMVKKGRRFEERARPKVEAAVAHIGHALRQEADDLQARIRDLAQQVEAMRAAAVASPQPAAQGKAGKRATRTPGKKAATSPATKGGATRHSAKKKAAKKRGARKRAAKKRVARKKAAP